MFLIRRRACAAAPFARLACFAARTLAAIVLAASAPAALAAEDPAEPLRFGILPSGGPLEARNEWEPLIAGMSRELGRPVHALSVTTFEALDAAIRRGDVDIAFLSGKMALDVVGQYDMTVVAEAQHDNRAVLVARKGAPPATLRDLLIMPGRLTLAHGEPQSLSGYLVPQLELFMPHRLRSETFFAGELTGTHEHNALAVANGEADVGTSSTADLERFKTRFPQEFDRLTVLWTSGPVPRAQLVVRRALPAELREKIRRYVVSYGHADGPRGEAERNALRQLHDFSGFVSADDASLMPAARLVYQLARASALNGRWVNETARQQRLQRIESEYARQLSQFNGAGKGSPVATARP